MLCFHISLGKKFFAPGNGGGSGGWCHPVPLSLRSFLQMYIMLKSKILKKKYLILLTQLLMLLLMLKQIRLKVKHVICCSPIAVENKIPNVSNLIKKNRL